MDYLLRALIIGLVVILPTVLVYRARRSVDRAGTEEEKGQAYKGLTNSVGIFAAILLGTLALVAVVVAVAL